MTLNNSTGLNTSAPIHDFGLSLAGTTTIFIPFSLMSLGGAVFIFSTYLYIKALQKRKLYKMVFFMSICDFMFALKFFLSVLTDHIFEDDIDALCITEAVLGHFFGLASISWYFCIVLNTYNTLGPKLVLSNRPTRWNHLFVWGLSAVTTIIAGATNSYGPSQDGTCWIKGTDNPYRLLFFVPLTLYMIAAICLIPYVLLRHRGTISGLRRRQLLFRMLMFVVVFVAVWIWPFILRLHQYAFESEGQVHPPTGLLVLHDIAVAGQGFFNFLVWTSSPAMRHFICSFLCERPSGPRPLRKQNSGLGSGLRSARRAKGTPTFHRVVQVQSLNADSHLSDFSSSNMGEDNGSDSELEVASDAADRASDGNYDESEYVDPLAIDASAELNNEAALQKQQAAVRQLMEEDDGLSERYRTRSSVFSSNRGSLESDPFPPNAASTATRGTTEHGSYQPPTI